MGEFTINDFYEKMESLFEPYQIIDILNLQNGGGEQFIKYNCYEDQLIIDDRTGNRITIKGNRWNDYTGDDNLDLDEIRYNAFNKLLHLIKINDKVRAY